MIMDKAYLNLAITLQECGLLALAAGKNVLYMEKLVKRDNSIVEYANKLQRMDRELPDLLQRAEYLKKILGEFNGIAME